MLFLGQRRHIGSLSAPFISARAGKTVKLTGCWNAGLPVTYLPASSLCSLLLAQPLCCELSLYAIVSWSHLGQTSWLQVVMGV